MKATRRTMMGVSLATVGLAAAPGILHAQPRPDEAWSLKKAAEPYRGQKIQIVLPTWKNAAETIGKEFTDQTGIQVQVSILPFDDLYEKTLLDARLGTGTYDVVSVESTWTGAFYGSGAIVPADTFFQDKALANPDYDNADIMNPRRYVLWQGRQYGLGLYSSSHLLYYRDDLFGDSNYQKQFNDKFGYALKPPTTWKEFQDAAEFFNTADWKTPTGEKGAGLVIIGKRGPDLWTLFLDRFAGMTKAETGKDVDLLDADHNPTFDNETGYRAMQAYADALKYAPKGALAVDQTEAWRLFMSGAAAMLEQWHTLIRAVNDPAQSKVAGKVRIALEPGGRPCIGGWGLGISKASKHKEAAFLFAQFLTSKENDLKAYLTDGKFPGRKSTLRTSEFNKIYPWNPDVLIQSIESASYTPNVPQTAALRDAFEPESSKVLTGDTDAKSAVVNIVQAWKGILKK